MNKTVDSLELNVCRLWSMNMKCRAGSFSCIKKGCLTKEKKNVIYQPVTLTDHTFCVLSTVMLFWIIFELLATKDVVSQYIFNFLLQVFSLYFSNFWVKYCIYLDFLTIYSLLSWKKRDNNYAFWSCAYFYCLAIINDK